MKKFFTLICALVGFAGVANAATVDDIAVCKHSYVLVCDQLGARPGKGVLFGNDHFLDVTGGSTATNKGQVDLSVLNEADDNHVNQYIVDKYGADYPGLHYNFLRLKNNQDVIAMKLTAKSKVIMFIQGNNKTGKDARIPCIAKTVDDIKNKTGLNAAPTADHPTTDAGFRWEYTVDDDGLFYVGSYNGDMFVSYIIVEANEAPGTPTVKVGDQTFENGLWFREVSCKANEYKMEGSDEGIPTIVTYTTDGSEPNATSPVYKEPIKCYKDMTVKFQAYQDWGMGADEAFKCDGADNDGNVNFVFDAPSIEADGATFTITSPYAEQNGANFYKLGDGEEIAGNGATLTESATVTAFTKITNGSYATFITKSTTQDVYVLNPIKEKKVIAVTAGTVVVDEEATATSTTGEVYKVEGGEISADKADFFVKNLTFGVVKDAQYQIDEKEIYIQMSNTNITFQVAEGDSVNVKVITSKNSCKMIENDDESKIDRKNYVNVSGTTYGNDDVTAEGGNIIEFGLTGGKTYTFQKYSGTGNILISSIEITPVATTPAEPGTLVGEKDWTTETTYPYYNMGAPEGASYEVKDGALEVTNTVKQSDIWGLQLFILDWVNVTAGNDYVVRVYASIPVDGQVQVNMGTWGGNDQHVFDVTASEAIKAYDFEFPQYAGATTTGNDAHVLWQQGWLLGTVKIAKVQLFEVSSTGIMNMVAEKAVDGISYNIAGQKVGNDFKGIVINNGKKFVIK